jgi:hypothetical protein
MFIFRRLSTAFVIALSRVHPKQQIVSNKAGVGKLSAKI